jgi:hypothetical protein
MTVNTDSPPAEHEQLQHLVSVEIPVLEARISELEEALRQSEQHRMEDAGFIGHKGLGQESVEWILARRAEIDALLDR